MNIVLRFSVVSLWAVQAAFGAGAEEPQADGFSWRATYREGMEAAVLRRRCLLVYLPPAGGRPEPLLLASVPRVLGAPPLVEGVRVGSADVEAILKRFEVKKLPALLLLDRRENVLLRSEGVPPASFWTVLKRLAGRQADLDAAGVRQAQEAWRLMIAGKMDAAYGKAAQLIQSPRTPPEILESALAVKQRLKEEGENALLRALAAEGLVSGAILGEKLQSLRSINPHPEVRDAIDRELERLKRSSQGSRREGEASAEPRRPK